MVSLSLMNRSFCHAAMIESFVNAVIYTEQIYLNKIEKNVQHWLFHDCMKLKIKDNQRQTTKIAKDE